MRTFSQTTSSTAVSKVFLDDSRLRLLTEPNTKHIGSTNGRAANLSMSRQDSLRAEEIVSCFRTREIRSSLRRISRNLRMHGDNFLTKSVLAPKRILWPSAVSPSLSGSEIQISSTSAISVMWLHELSFSGALRRSSRTSRGTKEDTEQTL